MYKKWKISCFSHITQIEYTQIFLLVNQSFLLEVDEELTQCLSPSSNSQNLHKAITFPSILADILVQFVWENSTSFNPSISPLPMAFTYASFRLQYLQDQVHPWLSSWPFFGSKNHFTSTKNSTLLWHLADTNISSNQTLSHFDI